MKNRMLEKALLVGGLLLAGGASEGCKQTEHQKCMGKEQGAALVASREETSKKCKQALKAKRRNPLANILRERAISACGSSVELLKVNVGTLKAKERKADFDGDEGRSRSCRLAGSIEASLLEDEEKRLEGTVHDQPINQDSLD